MHTLFNCRLYVCAVQPVHMQYMLYIYSHVVVVFMCAIYIIYIYIIIYIYVRIIAIYKCVLHSCIHHMYCV